MNVIIEIFHDLGEHIIMIRNKLYVNQTNVSICILGFDDLLTPAEKSKLYTAIGYSETDINHNLPKNVSHVLFDTHLFRHAFLVSRNRNNFQRTE